MPVAALHFWIRWLISMTWDAFVPPFGDQKVSLPWSQQSDRIDNIDGSSIQEACNTRQEVSAE